MLPFTNYFVNNLNDITIEAKPVRYTSDLMSDAESLGQSMKSYHLSE